MDSVFVAKLLGSYLLIISAVFLLRREAFLAFAHEFAEDRSLRYTIAFVELGVGLAIVLGHPYMIAGVPAVITAIGAMITVEALFHLLATDEHEQRLIDALSTDRNWWTFLALSFLVGGYLAAAGFGLL